MSFVGQQLVAVDVNSNQFWNYNNQNIRFLSIGNLQNMVAGRNVCLLRVPRGIQLMNNETEQVLDSVLGLGFQINSVNSSNAGPYESWYILVR